ncbi:MAG TPA: MauE/DoxX family redox-associated membrane protein [Terriglobia bacterium]|nr:MauE/DoxX family redox-associated membrane protein [Terriglobia bacterium]
MLSGNTGSAVVQVTLLVRFTLSCVLLLAAVMKWRLGDDFAFLLGVLGQGWSRRAPLVRIAVIASELVLGFLLFSGVWLAAAGTATAALFGAFLIVLACAFRRGYVEDCACFGDISGNPTGMFHLIRNGILFLLAVFLALEAHLRPVVTTEFREIPIALYVEAGFLVVTTFACYALLSEVSAAVKRR